MITRTQSKLGDHVFIPFTGKKGKIHEYLKNNPGEYHSQTIAQQLFIKNETVRRYLWQMHKDGVVDRKKMDGLNFYFMNSQPVYTPPTLGEIKYHGVTIVCNDPQKFGIEAFGTRKEEIFLIKDQAGKITTVTHKVGISGKKGEVERLGEVTLQSKGGTLAVWYGGSGRPLSCEEYEYFCGWLGGLFGCDVMGGWPEWGLSQVGLGIDDKLKWRHNRFGERGEKGSISIADFHGNVYEYYDKQLDNGEWVGRRGTHLNLGGECSTAECVSGIIDGSIARISRGDNGGESDGRSEWRDPVAGTEGR